MSEFGTGKTFSSGVSVKETKNMTVTNIKGSPEKGMKRLIVREKSGMRRSAGVDIPIKEAKNVERKETYSFKVEEKSETRYGRQSNKSSSASGFKTYYCDEAPEKYGGGGKSQFKSFGNSSRISSGRTKFH